MKSVHFGFKPFVCDYESVASVVCGKSFTRESKLKQHIDSVHRKIKPFECPVCYKSFTEKGSMLRHLKSMHTDNASPVKNPNNKEMKEMKYSCEICQKQFVLRDSLKRHELVHQGLMYSCNLCDKTFTQTGSLKRHIQVTHEGIKPFKCQYCDKSYSQRAHLRTHEETHLNTNIEKSESFSCQLCKKSFDARNILYDHIRTCCIENEDKVLEMTQPDIKATDDVSEEYNKKSTRLPRLGEQKMAIFDVEAVYQEDDLDEDFNETVDNEENNVDNDH